MIVIYLLAATTFAAGSFLKADADEFDRAGGPTPVQRVVALLQEIQGQLEKEASTDQAMYDELVCWCKTNNKEKTQAIQDAQSQITDLNSEIESRAGRQAELETQIKQLQRDVAKNKKALQQAEEIRAEEQSAFREQEKDLIQAISQLKNAVFVLSKHHEGLLQLTPELRESLKVVLHSAAEQHRALQVEKGRSPMVLLSVDSGSSEFVKALQGRVESTLPEKYASQIVASFVQGPSSYNARSGQIFGILKQMLEEFESNLTDAQKTEVKRVAEFQDLKTTKTAEIAAAEKQLMDKKGEAANNAKQMADAKEDLSSTRDTLASDREFLSNLTLQCQNIDHEWAQRSKTRSQEIAAISEALQMLTEDESREQLVKTSFIQMRATAALRHRAIDVLTSADVVSDLEGIWKGRNSLMSPKQQLATLAVQVSMDGFEKVKEAMDKLIAELKVEQEEDNKHKDFCNTEFDQNDRQQRDFSFKKEDLDTAIEGFDNQIETLSTEIADAQKQISELQVEIKRAGEDREKENAEFQTEVQDQRASQQILAKVLARLTKFYKKAALMQQTPPAKFGEYKQNQGASGVVSMLEKIIEDSKTAETEAVRDERESQTNYETFVKDSNASVKSLKSQIVSKNDAVTAARSERESSIADRASTMTELENLANYRAQLHGDCDFLVKNFDIRREARAQEVEAIGQAKAILSGSQ